MPGSQSSNTCSRWSVLLMGATLGLVHADHLTLADDNRLSGSIRSINQAGVIELSTDLSPEPLLLKPGAVQKVDFSIPVSDQVPASTLVELLNGDLLPVSIEGLNEERLDVVTAEAGRLSIPRASLKSMHLGVRVRQPIYAGPQKLDEWTRGAAGSSAWSFSNNALVANGPTSGSKKFDLPKRFVFKCTLKWQANPSYIIYFADPFLSETNLVDRYYMQFNSAGVEIKRESSKGKRFQTIILLAKTPDEFPGGQVDVELRVDRKTARIHLLLNGEPEGAGVDPNDELPVGQGVSLINQAQTGLNQEIRGIEILEFDDTRARHLQENRGDAALDSLISREEDRWTGRLSKIQKGKDGAVFSFQSDFQDSPLELAESDVATVFFAERKDAAPEDIADPSFALRLRGEGSLKVSSCVFSADSITASHSLLGELKIKRSDVAALELLESDPEPEAKGDPEP